MQRSVPEIFSEWTRSKIQGVNHSSLNPQQILKQVQDDELLSFFKSPPPTNYLSM